MAGSVKQDSVNQINEDEETSIHSRAKLLKELCLSNSEFFAKDSSENGQRLYISFLAIIDALDNISPKINEVQKRVEEFDFDEKTPGNGYGSFVNVSNLALKYAIELNNKILWKRNSMLFRKQVLTKEIEACSHLLISLDTCFKHLLTLMSWSPNGNLFVEDRPLEELISVCQDINQYCFYGRSMGFQFCDSLKNVLQFIALSMAIFSEAYYSQGSLISKATNSVMTTTKYITDPEQRAKRIVNISQSAEVDFCKSFWFLSESELMNQLPSVISPSVAVCKVISIAPEPFSLEIDGKQVEVPVPTSYLGPKPIQVRLISYQAREGMLGTKNKIPLEPPADGIIIHCHGGGFVAQSSKSHEGYLRDWAKHLNVPIVSIDYSLAPEAPFPRALEEVFYAYCWTLKNHDFLGSKGESIIAVGDSAGANLLLSATLKCISTGVPPPHGIFVAYVPTLIKFAPSPSRLLCMMDPLLPFGFMMRCLKAYACPPDKLARTSTEGDLYNSDTESFEEISESDLAELQAHKSPVSEASDTLTYGSLNSVENNPNEKDEVTSAEIEKSQQYMADIVHKYVLDPDTDTEGTKTPHLDPESSSSSALDTSFQTRLYGFVSSIKGHFSKMMGERGIASEAKLLENDRPGKLWEELCNPVPNDPFMSPYCASDDALKQFPPTKILTVQLDPCLDDCIMFARRLKAVGNNVTLDILEGLPHGFLNFSLISKDAYEGSKLCVQRMQELLAMDKDLLRPRKT
ncbi:hormone-sensitive lipase isoform X2 [Anthonomus grandis grandis]|uniref:hormone-sensitive lipase isoform X2 n=1 Tax=Anthonomus grandis grandis TaxID=2921223 RepID=UPI002166536C|nr:hormone-sensitive lipase isoform X2 [Anthonomus grandis grandis]